MTIQEPGALDRAAQRVGDRWVLLVIEALMDGPKRFNELTERVSGIAPNILTQRLRLLEQDGLVSARPYSTRPLRLAYELTGPAMELAGALRSLATWGARHEGRPDPHRHSVCGGPIELQPWCPTCARVVPEQELESSEDAGTKPAARPGEDEPQAVWL